jgi:prepilin-type N-terminal cleavage/methylation domain-containing protein
MAKERRRASRTAVTLVEVLVALAVASILMVVLYGAVQTFFARDSRASLVAMTDRTFAQKELRLGLTKLMLRIREGTKVLSPVPGESGPELVFRDVLNRKVRIRVDPATRTVVSEIADGAGWAADGPKSVTNASGQSAIVAYPVRIPNCANLCFTGLSPSCVVLSLTLASGSAENSLLTAIHVRNYNLALRGGDSS